jgi:tRNA nucleotidyltransferase/poly(A) polymerase
MNPAPIPNVAAEINRLHEEAKHGTQASREALHAALAAAWEAGHLLLTERKRVFHRMGPGAWLHWLEANFKGTARTAQRYMRLAQCVADVSFLQGMSLRQVYARLGIATEPKTNGQRRLRHRLPAHVFLANRLVRALKRRPGQTSDEQVEAYRRDLRALYDKLRPWFESAPAVQMGANFGGPPRSHRV